MSDDEEHWSPHVSQVTRVDDEGSGPPEFVCHMQMRERPSRVDREAVIEATLKGSFSRMGGRTCIKGCIRLD